MHPTAGRLASAAQTRRGTPWASGGSAWALDVGGARTRGPRGPSGRWPRGQTSRRWLGRGRESRAAGTASLHMTRFAGETQSLGVWGAAPAAAGRVAAQWPAGPRLGTEGPACPAGPGRNVRPGRQRGPREGTAGRGGVWAPAGRCAAVTVARGGHSAPTAWSCLTVTRGCRGPRGGRGHWEGAGGGDRGPWGAGMGITPGGGHRNRSAEGTAGRGPWTGHPRAQADSGAPRGAPRPRQAQERPSGGETAMPRAGVCTASPRGPHPAQLRPRGRGRWAVSPSATGSVRGLPPPQAR